MSKKYLMTLLLIVIILSSFHCAKLPKPRAKSESVAIDPPTSGAFVEAKHFITEKFGDGQSGFVLTETNEEALHWRLMLIDMAQHTIDIQTFLWHTDPAGILVLDRLLKAADRGVRLRLLPDDLGLGANDKTRSLMNSHPLVNIRSFNPAANRSTLGEGVNYITRMKRMNHRMHNKLMVFDNIAAIVGGRNIGDEYFGLGEKFNFSDLDAIVIGDVAAQLSQSFDIYWNSDLAYTPESFAGTDGKKTFRDLRQEHHDFLVDSQNHLSQFDLEPRDWTQEFRTLYDRFVGGTAEVVHDNPSDVGREELTGAAQGIANVVLLAENDLLISSPYYIPGDWFYENLPPKIEQGFSVKVLTNSVMTNNHLTAYSAYKKHRKRTLNLGAELYELHHESEIKPIFDTPPVVSNLVGLHTKTFVLDRRYVFLGSLNQDPRSVILNTEMGLIIDSPELAEQVAQMVESYMQPENAWQLTLNEKGKLVWESSLGTRTSAQTKNIFQKIGAWIFGILPIESQM